MHHLATAHLAAAQAVSSTALTVSVPLVLALIAAALCSWRDHRWLTLLMGLLIGLYWGDTAIGHALVTATNGFAHGLATAAASIGG